MIRHIFMAPLRKGLPKETAEIVINELNIYWQRRSQSEPNLEKPA